MKPGILPRMLGRGTVRWALLLVSLAGIPACGGATPDESTIAGSADVPAEVTDENFPSALRAFHSLSLDHPARPRLRAALEAHIARATPAILEAGDYDAAVDQFARLTSLAMPEDFRAGRVAHELAPVARFLVERGSPRGDEARVLAALTVLRLIETSGGAGEEYERIVQWGREARQTVPGELDRYSRLIDVWEEHARLTPLPDVLDALARLYVERRDAIVAVLERETPQMVMPSMEDFAELRAAPVLLRRAPLDVAAIWLRHGDLATAVTRVEAMGDVSGTEVRLARLLAEARDGGDDGADALLELAMAYRTARPDVALGLCRLGHRREPEDARYPLCLARVTAQLEDFASATAWYAKAIELAPEDRELYDEALERLNLFIESGLFDSDPSLARGLVAEAERILAMYSEHWPEARPPIPQDRFQYLVGMLELNAGQGDAARARFERALELRETPDALIQLGRLALAAGNGDDAARRFRRALDLTQANDRPGAAARADTLQLLGDAFREQGDAEQATRMYREALSGWDAIAGNTAGEARANIEVRRGILLDRLGDRDPSRQAFDAAMEAAPTSRETYARILSHLVVAQPDIDLATAVFERAQRETALEPEWKVYFALWLSTIAARAGRTNVPAAQTLLHELSSTEGWPGSLARFGVGELQYDELLEVASGIAEQTEAYFYEGTRLLASGDAAGAQRMFQRVLQSNMVNFFEFTMAQELVVQPATR